MTKQATAEQKRRYSAIVELGCIVGPSTYCEGRITIHHCGTNAGGRKNHWKTIPLCEGHHIGKHGVDGGHISKRQWQSIYGNESDLLAKVEKCLILQDRSSIYKGLSYVKRDNVWRVVITKNGKQIYLGSSSNETKAAKMYNEAAVQMHGIYAKLNNLEEVHV